MSNQYPSARLEQYPRKIAFLIDCVTGMHHHILRNQLIELFPSNSDIFLFYHNDAPKINNRLRRLESDAHGVFFFPTTVNGVSMNVSFILGVIHDKYDDFILVTAYDPIYEDICKHLIDHNQRLEYHIQVRSFDRQNEFEQFLTEMTRLQTETEDKRATGEGSNKLIFTKEHLFHSCPYETREQSSNIYRFGQLLHHLDNEHPELSYHFCKTCENLLHEQNHNRGDEFGQHIEQEHWKHSRGFELSIQPPSQTTH